jgi:HK97 family phage major capsid protein
LVAEGDATVADYTPGSAEIHTAMRARQGLKALFRSGNVDRIEPEFRKELSAFSFGNNGFLLAPEMSNRVLSCLVDPTDLSGLVDSITISSPAVRFVVDNARMELANWACESSCFHNQPQPDLQEGLGELTIKPESLRYVVCATADLLADASFPVETWIIDKVSRGMRAAINASILLGDGIGKPLGILSSSAGVPICEVSPATPPGQFSWADLMMLKYEIPLQWLDQPAFFMNQRTFELLQTMSSAEGRPLFGAPGTTTPGTGFPFAGSPIHIVSQLPDVAPGATPILFGNLKAAYLVVLRKAVTMMVDPYSAGWCQLFKFEARVGALRYARTPCGFCGSDERSVGMPARRADAHRA